MLTNIILVLITNKWILLITSSVGKDNWFLQGQSGKGCTDWGVMLLGWLNFVQSPNICGSSEWKFFHVTLLVPRILRWLLYLLNICAPLNHYVSTGIYCVL